jgi:hypothetical protein
MHEMCKAGHGISPKSICVFAYSAVSGNLHVRRTDAACDRAEGRRGIVSGVAGWRMVASSSLMIQGAENLPMLGTR